MKNVKILFHQKSRKSKRSGRVIQNNSISYIPGKRIKESYHSSDIGGKTTYLLKEENMSFKTVRVKHKSTFDRRLLRDKRFPSATREDINKAMEAFLAEGGKIKRIEPEWIEEGNSYTFS